ncbi:helix-turn-helix transcriptional regulator [uncultured Alistipes sp.]|uniref:helix-turn-helix domain-containing protein n=1 Tax=uncultured Alistipes sp. TaxID=538949 RepID=UPI002617654B|nr:helix-turn-helix transcriptional regulator [uncultured Alistipes sp.]
MKTSVDLYVIDAVRRERKAQKVSQAMLSYGIGVSRGFVGQVESPKFETKYNIQHINEIAKFLGLLAPQVSARKTLLIQLFSTLRLRTNRSLYSSFHHFVAGSTPSNDTLPLLTNAKDIDRTRKHIPIGLYFIWHNF